MGKHCYILCKSIRGSTLKLDNSMHAGFGIPKWSWVFSERFYHTSNCRRISDIIKRYHALVLICICQERLSFSVSPMCTKIGRIYLLLIRDSERPCHLSAVDCNRWMVPRVCVGPHGWDGHWLLFQPTVLIVLLIDWIYSFTTFNIMQAGRGLL